MISKVVQTIQVFYQTLLENEKGIGISVQNGYPTFCFHFISQPKPVSPLQRSLWFIQLQDLLQLRFYFQVFYNLFATLTTILLS